MGNLTANLGSKVKLSRTRHEDAEERVFLGSLEVSVLAIGPNVRGFKPGQGRYKSAARLPSEGKQSRRPYVVKFAAC
jgi:hypothetical protein